MSVTYHTNKSYEGYDNVVDRFHSTISLNVLDEEATTSTVTCHVQRGQLIVVFGYFFLKGMVESDFSTHHLQKEATVVCPRKRIYNGFIVIEIIRAFSRILWQQNNTSW